MTPMLGFNGNVALYADRGNAANTMVDFDWIEISGLEQEK